MRSLPTVSQYAASSTPSHDCVPFGAKIASRTWPIAASSAAESVCPVHASRLARIRATDVDEMSVVATRLSRSVKCSAIFARSTPLLSQYAAASLHSAFVAAVAGCQSGGSRPQQSSPIEIGDALISAICRAAQKSTNPDETSVVSLRE